MLTVSRETRERLERFAAILVTANDQQNLVSQHSLADLWRRHIEDSAQLVAYGQNGIWVDIGSGGGLPGIVVAILRTDPVILIEPRRLRAEFLRHCSAELGLTHVDVRTQKVEQATGQADIISARAVAALPKLLTMAHHLSHPGTIWVLPKGRVAASELESAREAWQGDFHMKPSQTEAGSSIIVARHVEPKR